MSAPDQEYRLPNGGPSIAALPKVSLHDHLDGGLRPGTIVELAAEAGIALPVDTSGDSAVSLEAWFVESASAGSLPEYLATFSLTVGVMQTAANLTRVAHEFVLDLAADGVIHGEVRWAPSQHLAGGLTLDEAVEAVQAGFDAICASTAGNAVNALTDGSHGCVSAAVASACPFNDGFCVTQVLAAVT